jgi:site-specific recombinase XerD
MVPMNPDLITAYKEWIEQRGQLETVRLFVTRKGTPITRQGIHDQLKNTSSSWMTKKYLPIVYVILSVKA